MKVCEYLSVRRAFGLVRQSTPASGRITFDELGIMCHLANVGEPLRTSEIAEHQGVLRPNRTGHLADLGFIERRMGENDRRSVFCSLTPAGVSEVRRVVTEMCRNITAGMPLCRCVPRRMSLIIDECARVSVSSADMVLVALSEVTDGQPGRSVSELVAFLGLLLVAREGRPSRPSRSGRPQHRRRSSHGDGPCTRRKDRRASRCVSRGPCSRRQPHSAIVTFDKGQRARLCRSSAHLHVPSMSSAHRSAAIPARVLRLAMRREATRSPDTKDHPRDRREERGRPGA